MTWLFEDPTWIWIIGGFGAAVLLMMLFSTGRGIYLLWLAAAALATAALLAVERYVVTDRELIEATIYGAQAAVEDGDVEGVISYISPAGQPLADEVRRRMQSIKVHDAAVAGLKIEPHPLDDNRAIATFLGRMEFSTAGLARGQYFGRMTVELIKENGRWLVESYSVRGDR